MDPISQGNAQKRKSTELSEPTEAFHRSTPDADDDVILKKANKKFMDEDGFEYIIDRKFWRSGVAPNLEIEKKKKRKNKRSHSLIVYPTAIAGK